MSIYVQEIADNNQSKKTRLWNALQDVVPVHDKKLSPRPFASTAIPASYICVGRCRLPLAEPEDVRDDNSNASVGCECPCQCDAWSCWKCARYTQEMADEDLPWFCETCVRQCENVYQDV